MNSTRTLHDFAIEQLFDGPSGELLRDSMGTPDDPRDYVVLEHEDEGQREFILVRGPSGDLDMVVRNITGVRIYRDVDSRINTIATFKAAY